MSNKTQKVIDSEKRTDTIVGIITVLAVLALIVWLFVSISVRGSALSEVAYDGEVRRGFEQTFTTNVQSNRIKDGDTVKWTVNGEKVAEDVYVAGQPLTLNYTPKTSGQTFITAQVGKYSKTAYLDVLPPQLTVSAPNIVVTYGEQLPDLKYDCCGFVDEDTREMMEYDGMCYVCRDNGDKLTADKLDVGVYKLSLDENCSFKDYEVNYVGGTLTVLPKKIAVEGNFVKTYDSCNAIENPSISLSGVQEGDEVTAKCDKLYFEDKNAGVNKTIMLANVELEGADSRNYVLEGQATGAILPKQIEISGLVIRDKMYDGTTKAQIDKMGRLDGVIDGDSVAIGNLQLSFAEAEAGEQQIVLDDVSLIGADKDNYVVNGVDVESANINSTIWSKIFVKNPAIAAEA